MSKEDDDFASIPVSKPSIFEVVAHEAVAAVFRPAFHYVVRILAQKYPDKLGFSLKCADDIYALRPGASKTLFELLQCFLVRELLLLEEGGLVIW